MNTRIPISIEKLIESINSKLPKRIIAYEQKPSLCLWNVTVVNTLQPVIDESDHVRKMKLAWLAHGKVGLMNYIEPFLKPRSIHKVRRIILSIE